MSMAVSNKKGPKSDINITPYIDILLVLLIIFMVITPVRQLDLDVKVPQPPPADTKVEPDPSVIVVSVGESAQIAINQDPTDIGSLGSKLQQIYNARANKNMFVSASPKLPYGDVVKVIDIAKGAGVGDVGLITEDIQGR
jgi:biopolymer transport protein TolR